MTFVDRQPHVQHKVTLFDAYQKGQKVPDLQTIPDSGNDAIFWDSFGIDFRLVIDCIRFVVHF